MRNNKKTFEHFDSEGYQAYQNRLLIGVLEVILAQKGELTPEDIPKAYEQSISIHGWIYTFRFEKHHEKKKESELIHRFLEIKKKERKDET